MIFVGGDGSTGSQKRSNEVNGENGGGLADQSVGPRYARSVANRSVETSSRWSISLLVSTDLFTTEAPVEDRRYRTMRGVDGRRRCIRERCPSAPRIVL